MKAVHCTSYGPADVLHVQDAPRPEIADNDVLVSVHAASVTTADWRLRASAFPAVFWLAGRLMFGLCAPRNPIPGSDYAGRIVALGRKVTRFKMGDAVFGCSRHGAHAEFLSVPEDGAIIAKPANLDFDEAAAVPFGALTALVFLRDFAKIRAGRKILIIGASGGVGIFAVQLAKHFGAHVTGVCSAANRDLVMSIGADHVIDYALEDFTADHEQYDVILDTVGNTTFTRCRGALTPKGIFLPLEFKLREILQAMMTSKGGGRKVVIGISGDNLSDLAVISAMLERGEIRPIIDGRYPLDHVAAAHRRVESRHKTGAVVLTVSKAPSLRSAA